jgi:hypothetical protein
MNRGPSPRLFPLENNKTDYSMPLCKKALVLIQYQPTVHEFSRRPLVFEIILDIPLATFQKF